MSHLVNSLGPVLALGAGAGLLGLVHAAMVRIERMRPPKPVWGTAKTSAKAPATVARPPRAR